LQPFRSQRRRSRAPSIVEAREPPGTLLGGSHQQQTVACAEKIMRATIDTYAPSKTIRELHELAQRGSGIDLLRISAKSRARSCGHSRRCNAVPGRTFHAPRAARGPQSTQFKF
jgi:hypothetical protein